VRHAIFITRRRHSFLLTPEEPHAFAHITLPLTIVVAATPSFATLFAAYERCATASEMRCLFMIEDTPSSAAMRKKEKSAPPPPLR